MEQQVIPFSYNSINYQSHLQEACTTPKEAGAVLALDKGPFFTGERLPEDPIPYLSPIKPNVFESTAPIRCTTCPIPAVGEYSAMSIFTPLKVISSNEANSKSNKSKG